MSARCMRAACFLFWHARPVAWRPCRRRALFCLASLLRQALSRQVRTFSCPARPHHCVSSRRRRHARAPNLSPCFVRGRFFFFARFCCLAFKCLRIGGFPEAFVPLLPVWSVPFLCPRCSPCLRASLLVFLPRPGHCYSGRRRSRAAILHLPRCSKSNTTSGASAARPLFRRFFPRAASYAAFPAAARWAFAAQLVSGSPCPSQARTPSASCATRRCWCGAFLPLVLADARRGRSRLTWMRKAGAEKCGLCHRHRPARFSPLLHHRRCIHVFHWSRCAGLTVSLATRLG
ncbi:hypothetical protein, conserved in T. vivax [Trypanosoma vivax Y486]|uniref:Uncharacterized protein n=1 Tax=Trypanosoma vivax (strain Y486) TaxID=1055687 RepID=F9WKP3_TRYVY|nr:hypothetical protein, conserved in T. vivax [Trypanosoma vivax Y486]|eukprot:CCD18066.1 hypothetical protein, conserved in T. vivax [Trypanosoma vivax Y486]